MKTYIVTSDTMRIVSRILAIDKEITAVDAIRKAVYLEEKAKSAKYN